MPKILSCFTGKCPNDNEPIAARNPFDRTA
jgi:hypothetical protein